MRVRSQAWTDGAYNLAKVRVVGSNPIARSIFPRKIKGLRAPFGAFFAYMAYAAALCNTNLRGS